MTVPLLAGYVYGPLSALERNALHVLIDRARRAQLERDRAREAAACACGVCVGQREGVHGLILSKRRVDRCICPVCRAAKSLYEHERRVGARRVASPAAML